MFSSLSLDFSFVPLSRELFLILTLVWYLKFQSGRSAARYRIFLLKLTWQISFWIIALIFRSQCWLSVSQLKFISTWFNIVSVSAIFTFIGSRLLFGVFVDKEWIVIVFLEFPWGDKCTDFFLQIPTFRCRQIFAMLFFLQKLEHFFTCHFLMIFVSNILDNFGHVSEANLV